jgi:hypothetical protein
MRAQSSCRNRIGELRAECCRAHRRGGVDAICTRQLHRHCGRRLDQFGAATFGDACGSWVESAVDMVKDALVDTGLIDGCFGQQIG